MQGTEGNLKVTLRYTCLQKMLHYMSTICTIIHKHCTAFFSTLYAQKGIANAPSPTTDPVTMDSELSLGDDLVAKGDDHIPKAEEFVSKVEQERKGIVLYLHLMRGLT